MVIDMNDEQFQTLRQMQAFLDGTVAIDFAVDVEERYGFIARTVRRFGYARLRRADCGIYRKRRDGAVKVTAPPAPRYVRFRCYWRAA